MNAGFELLIQRCRIVDGTGNPWFWGDVGISHGAIQALGDLSDAAANERVEGKGLVLAPGFIDSHIHSEWSLLREPVHKASLFQGVTTHIVGQDGVGFAPATAETLEYMRRYLAGIHGPDVVLEPGSVRSFLSRFDTTTVVNVATLVPNGCVRMNAMGGEGRTPSPMELKAMRDDCACAIEQGAVGLSSGLDYPPSGHASTDELVALCSAIAPLGGVYVSHVRYKLGLLQALKEAIEIGRRGCPARRGISAAAHR